MQEIKSMTEKNGPALLAISIAMRIRRYCAEPIAQSGRSRATLDATGRRHRASIRPFLAIKRYYQTKIGEVTKLQQSS